MGKPGVDVGWAGIDGRNAETGSKIEWVHKEGPAAKAGVKKDDILISIDGKTVLSNAQMHKSFNQHEVGAVVKIDTG